MSEETWLTPLDIVEELGPFDMDPCCPPTMPWRTAETMIHMPDNGLTTGWVGNVWLNPPYNRFCWSHWIPRLATHGQGMALVIPRTDKWEFHRYVMDKASALFFFKGRIKFCYPDGREALTALPWPSMLVAYGEHKLESFSREGSYVKLRDVY